MVKSHWFAVFSIIALGYIHLSETRRPFKLPPARPCAVNNGHCDHHCADIFLPQKNKYTRRCSCRPDYNLGKNNATCTLIPWETKSSKSGNKCHSTWYNSGGVEVFLMLVAFIFLGYVFVLLFAKIQDQCKKKTKYSPILAEFDTKDEDYSKEN
ncbi:uncharacterized protein LOC143450290 [Clavelina lepadiformis]|uniref:Uncharacterized protein n=1 Tax=Clavelina lepadiformis TaxID=159417 RepID=A0ABP0GFT4_CLALP